MQHQISHSYIEQLLIRALGVHIIDDIFHAQFPQHLLELCIVFQLVGK